MGADWTPGTVAVATVRGVKGLRVWRLNSAAWVTAEILDGSKVHGDSEVTDVRPIVVLDLDALPIRPKPSTLSVLRQWQRIAERDGQRVDANVLGAIADQIEAQAKPPRIPEPGLWGVVEAHNVSPRIVRKWVHYGSGWRDAFDNHENWDGLIDPVLIREGVADLLDDDAMLAAQGHGTTARIDVALDALAVINNLTRQADDMDENAALIDALRPTLWATACQHPSSMHPSLLCYLEQGHDGGHLYTVARGRAA